MMGYQRAEFLAERKAAVEAWAGFVAEGKTLITLTAESKNAS